MSVLVAGTRPSWVKSLVVYTLPCDLSGYLWYFERFAPRSLDRFYTDGKAWLPGLGDYLKRSFLDDLFNHNIKREIARLRIPMLLIQPDNDDEVPKWCSDQAYELKPEPKNYFLIKGTHTMHLRDASGGPTGWNFEQEEEVTGKTLEWFKTTLST